MTLEVMNIKCEEIENIPRMKNLINFMAKNSQIVMMQFA